MPYPSSQAIKIKIDGTDRTTPIPHWSIQITGVITKQIDTCSFTVKDASAMGIAELDEVIISNVAEDTRYFAGYITVPTKVVRGVEFDLACVCQDYTYLLDKVIVNWQFIGMTDAAIITDLFSTYLSSIEATTYVEALLTAAQIPEITFNRVTLKQALEMLAEMSGGDWYVDYGPGPGSQKAYLHYFAVETNVAPYDISDSPDLSATFPAEGLSVTRDATDHINLVTVVGGDYLSDDTDFLYAADGTQTLVQLDYEFEPPDGETKPLVYTNSGTDGTPSWTAKTVGIDYIDNPANYDLLFNKVQKLLKFAAAPPDLKLSVKLSGRYEVPLRQRVRDQASYDTYGLWLEGVLVDADIVDKQVAKERAKGELDRRAVRDVISCNVREPGLVAGQRIKVTDTVSGLDDYYNIQTIVTRFLGGGKAEFGLELS